MKKIEVNQMEMIQGGKECAPITAGIALGSAVVSLFFPPAAALSWVAVGSWMSQCLK